MEQYIPKAAVVAEIEKIIADETESIKSFEHSKNVSEVQRSNARIGVLTHLCSLLDTLEVKEVDLDYIKNELDEVVRIYKPDGDFGWGTLYNVATHFFELGLKAQKGE